MAVVRFHLKRSGSAPQSPRVRDQMIQKVLFLEHVEVDNGMEAFGHAILYRKQSHVEGQPALFARDDPGPALLESMLASR